jgi:hypothetical protein
LHEQHLNFFTAAAGNLKFGCLGKGPREIPGVFVDVSWNLARDSIRAAPRLKFADVAILLAGAVMTSAVDINARPRRGVVRRNWTNSLPAGQV